ncbi:unnamed protein product [Prunus armeniaca]
MMLPLSFQGSTFHELVIGPIKSSTGKLDKFRIILVHETNVVFGAGKGGGAMCRKG